MPLACRTFHEKPTTPLPKCNRILATDYGYDLTHEHTHFGLLGITTNLSPRNYPYTVLISFPSHVVAGCGILTGNVHKWSTTFMYCKSMSFISCMWFGLKKKSTWVKVRERLWLTADLFLYKPKSQHSHLCTASVTCQSVTYVRWHCGQDFSSLEMAWEWLLVNM